MAEMGISPVSKDWTGDPGDLKSRSDRILMKVALEGKSFQQARTEVEAEAAGPFRIALMWAFRLPTLPA